MAMKARDLQIFTIELAAPPNLFASSDIRAIAK